MLGLRNMYVKNLAQYIVAMNSCQCLWSCSVVVVEVVVEVVKCIQW